MEFQGQQGLNVATMCLTKGQKKLDQEKCWSSDEKQSYDIAKFLIYFDFDLRKKIVLLVLSLFLISIMASFGFQN